jgi:GntP family gluconate:H+ symporter
MASIIGKCLLDSGAADRIVRSTLRVVGEKRAGLAFMGSGFLLSIPVFFDTVFYLMIPLAKAMRLRTGKNYLLFILAIVAGGAMAHSLVPPTPGPLIVADMLDVSILDMMIGGIIVGLFASTAGYLFAVWINRRMEIPLRDAPDASIEELTAQANRSDSELPSIWISILPILLPVLLIAAATATKTYLEGNPAPAGWLVSLKPTIMTLGDKNMALILAAVIAMLMLIKQQPDRKKLAASVQHALAGGGIIILITSAGGGFGAAIRQSGIAEQIAMLQEGVQPLMILPIAFLITTLIRTAQGSATVAMITAGSVLAPLALQGDLPFHSVYLALAIGCGSKPVAWMADSGFWVICKMSGMTEQEALKTVTPNSIVMGLTGLAVTLVLAILFPLAG